MVVAGLRESESAWFFDDTSTIWRNSICLALLTPTQSHLSSRISHHPSLPPIITSHHLLSHPITSHHLPTFHTIPLLSLCLSNRHTHTLFGLQQSIQKFPFLQPWTPKPSSPRSPTRHILRFSPCLPSFLLHPLSVCLLSQPPTHTCL